MPDFWLTYGDANRIMGAIILEAPTMLQARMDAAVRGLDRGAPFAEGHHLNVDLIASVSSTKIGRMMSGAEAAHAPAQGPPGGLENDSPPLQRPDSPRQHMAFVIRR
jgi:hypothetical protein